MREGEELIKCEICGKEMKKSQARSYGQTTPEGGYMLHWICPLMDSPSCYVDLLVKLSMPPHSRMYSALENGR